MVATKQGATVSDKTIALAAIEGRQVSFRWPGTPVGDRVEGFIIGMDDYHWAVIEPDNLSYTYLIHKSSAPIVAVSTEPSYDEQDNKEGLERFVEPFRRAMGKTYKENTPS